MTQSLETYNPTDLVLVGNPRSIIAQAKEAATALMAVVEEQHLYMEKGESRHLYIEAWELLGAFYGVSAGTSQLGDVRDLYENGQYLGSEAYATLVDKNGMKIGGASAVVLREEPGREDMPIFQMRSMAQTRAASKAHRLKLAYVAVLAGFSGTPAEEMTQEEKEARMNVPRCPTHPRRNPREWTANNKPLWKCTAKVGDGYCTWSAPREDMPTVAPGNPPAQPPAAATPPSPTSTTAALTELAALAKQLNWDKGELMDWLRDNGHLNEQGGIKSPAKAIKALQGIIAAEAPADEPKQ